jgi:rubrerythrin
MKRLKALSSADALAMAICLEGANAARYSVWADRFRPYNKEFSSLLDGLAQEDRLSHTKLKKIFTKKYNKELDSSIMDQFDDIVDRSNPDLEHFFVLDEEMSKSIMYSVLKAEYETLAFFQKALHETKDDGLKKIFRMLADYEKQHVNEIRESLEHEKGTLKGRTAEDIESADQEIDDQKMFGEAYKSTRWQNGPKKPIKRIKRR